MDFLNTLLDSIDDALVVTKANGEILFFNKEATVIGQTTGVSLDVGGNIINNLSGERKGVVESIFKEILTSKQEVKSFAEYKDKFNNTLYLEFKHVPLVNEEGAVSHVFIIFRDVTPQKIFEKRLVTQAANISNLIDKANAIIIGVDTRGYITDWNVHCSEITGFTKDEVFARKFSEILLAEEEKPIFDELMKHVLLKEVFANYELTIYTKQKKQRQFLLNSSIRASEAGTVIGVVFVGHDATELLNYRRSLEQQVMERTHELQQSLAKEKEIVDMKSRFVSVASHEFRTPLSSIEHAATFIKDHRHIKPSQLTVKLETIEKQIKHMTRLLDDVLTYGQSEAGKIKLIVSTVVFSDFINKIVEDVCNSTKNTHRIDLQIDEIPKHIITDEKLLRNIIINLLSNAIKFSPGKEFVNLVIKYENQQLIFEVSDQGIGIPEDELVSIFEPFERGKAAASIQGTGLGLSIVKKAVELLGGGIDITSSLSKGTTVTVTIPCKNEN